MKIDTRNKIEIDIPLSKRNNYEFGWIYYLCQDDIVVYIGKASDYNQRITFHKKDKVFNSVYISEKFLYEHLKDIETEEIRKYMPIYNIDKIFPSDWKSDNCDIIVEFPKFSIIRSIGHIDGRFLYKKDNIVYVDLGKGSDNNYMFLKVNLLTKEIGKPIEDKILWEEYFKR